MANPTKLGELSEIYFQIADIDLSGDQSTNAWHQAILTDPVWTKLCIIDATIPKASDTREILDRCSPEFRVYTGGKKDWSLTYNVNEFRFLQANATVTVPQWHTAIDTNAIISYLILNDDILSPDTWGIVCAGLTEQNDDTQPAEGPNTVAYTIRLHAEHPEEMGPVAARIYGSTFIGP